MSFALAAGVGAVTGVLSSWGVGGGTLLVIYMTAAAGLAQQQAQGINLLYFIPTSAFALISHAKNRLIEKSAVIPAIAAGVPAALVTSFLASGIDAGVLKKIFGGFLILVGAASFFGNAARRGAA